MELEPDSKEYRPLMKIFTNEVSAIPPRHPRSLCPTPSYYVATQVSLLGSVRHRHIVRLHQVVREPNAVFLVMDRCSGGDLFDEIERQGGILPETKARKVAAQLLEALRYLHDEAHIAHCDIKLANVLFDTADPDSNIKLIDFGMTIAITTASIVVSISVSTNTAITITIIGLSRRLRAGETTSGRVGTTSFMSPEQVKGLHFDHSVDMWGLGKRADVSISIFISIPIGTSAFLQESYSLYVYLVSIHSIHTAISMM